jgi:hypothetical protein
MTLRTSGFSKNIPAWLLVGGREVGAEPFVQHLNRLGERHLLILVAAGADFGWRGKAASGEERMVRRFLRNTAANSSTRARRMLVSP